MTAAQIFRGYVRFIGVGAIATAGIFGILKSLRIVAGSFGVALTRLPRAASTRPGERTDRDTAGHDHPGRRRRQRASAVAIFLGNLAARAR